MKKLLFCKLHRLVLASILINPFYANAFVTNSYETANKYLENYGYIPRPGPQTKHAAIQTMDKRKIDKGIQKFQEFFRLPNTSKLDDKTLKLMKSPRCGNPDLMGGNEIFKQSTLRNQRRYKRYVYDGKTYWNKRNLTYKILSFPKSGLSRKKVKSIFRKSMNMWARVANINFREEYDTRKNADIVILFGSRKHLGDNIPFDGPGKVLAHAFYPNPWVHGYTRNGDAHFDDDEIWVDGTSGGKNLLAVAVHELGHSLGLDHSNDRKAIMYPYYISPSDGNIKLDIDDINGMQKIYGPPKPNKHIPFEPSFPPEFPDPTARPTTETEFIPKIGPNPCEAAVDAVFLIRGIDIYVSQNKWQWRLGWSLTVNNWHTYELKDGPLNFQNYWPVLPKSITKFDSSFERSDNLIYFFSGRRYWMVKDNQNFAAGFSSDGQPITELGLPENLDHIDAMFRWGHNQHIYIFAGDVYWKFDEKTYRNVGYVVKVGYPRKISTVWHGIPVPVDAAYTGINNITYFFKGRNYYSFNNLNMRIREGFPRPAKLPWLGCFENNLIRSNDYRLVQGYSMSSSSEYGKRLLTMKDISILCYLVVLLVYG